MPSFVSDHEIPAHFPTDPVAVTVSAVGTASGLRVIEGTIDTDVKVWILTDRRDEMMLGMLTDPHGAVITVPRWRIVKGWDPTGAQIPHLGEWHVTR
jgi:hypothetical protein